MGGIFCVKALVGGRLQNSDLELGEMPVGTGVLAWDSSQQGPWAPRWVRGDEGDSLQHLGELWWGLEVRGGSNSESESVDF